MSENEGEGNPFLSGDEGEEESLQVSGEDKVDDASNEPETEEPVDEGKEEPRVESDPFNIESDSDEERLMTVKRPRPQSSDEENEDKSSEKKRHLEEEEEEGDDSKNLEKEKEKEILPQETNDDNNEEEEEEEVRMKETVEEDDDDDNDGQILEEKEARGDDDDDDDEREGSAENLEQLENELLGLEQSENIEAPAGGGGHHSSDSELEDSKEPKVYDFDVMMQRRKEAMARARRKKKTDSDSTAYDDQILVMIRHMKEAAEEDRRSNLQQKAATKKLQFLPTVIAHLRKSEFLNALIECGICSALADWLKPLPDHSLPHQKIRENILDSLKLFPLLDGHILKTSGLGKAIMLLYRHPKEIKKNREKAGKLINKWARPVFGLTDDFKGLSRDEREERDWAHLSQAARRRLSSDSRESDPSRQDESEAQKPGDKGWVGRARVPLPSNKDYVVRPKWNKQHEFSKGGGKKTLNRYEKQVQKKREKTARGKNTHAVSISIEGRKMPL